MLAMHVGRSYILTAEQSIVEVYIGTSIGFRAKVMNSVCNLQDAVVAACSIEYCCYTELAHWLADPSYQNCKSFHHNA
jgi:hypothetical protein